MINTRKKNSSLLVRAVGSTNTINKFVKRTKNGLFILFRKKLKIICEITFDKTLRP
jgi:hypothetical protein